MSGPAAHTPLVYAFGGFHPRYYTMRYDTPDATALARRVAGTMPDGEPVHQHAGRGLDHGGGAWVPLMAMYPLAEEGVLVIGSGFMMHGLPFISRAMLEGQVPGWSADFDAWAADALARGMVDELAAFRTRAPGMPYAHPTVDHYIPLFITLGAAAHPDRPVRTTVEGYTIGFSKHSFQTAV
ncbi:dioxygenase family protein [Streptomyces canus]|uniref:dioxygenase family protein n=1 Tax=Streptomyces canus TaxID=58343 RepID=UPI002789AF7D|nr:class III extradiol ring-cleavage dioxygenase [Streptomyces canus]MDQ0761506.1 4,5-DOPA dioxygenase extradiol [Streptomyces canus]